jgi:uncharacterized protein DUF5372
VTFEHPDGGLHSAPVNWTDAVPADPYLSVGRGRSSFRVEDLLALADLVATPGGPVTLMGRPGVSLKFRP